MTELTETSGVPHVVARSAWIALYVASLASLLFGFNLTVMNVVLPSIEKAFGSADRATLAWGISGYSITVAALMLIGGRAADRLGRLLIFKWGLGVFVAGSLATALAPGAPWFIGGRLIQAVGAALLSPASLSMVLPLFPSERKATAISIWAAISYLGSGIAPGFAATMADRFGWRSIFFVFAAVGTAVLFVAPRFLPQDPPRPPADRVDSAGASAGAIGLGLAAYACIDGPRAGWVSAPVLGAAVIGAVLLTVFTARSLHHPEPLLDLRMLRPRAVWSTLLANVLLTLAGTAVWVLYALFLVHQWKWPLTRIGLSLMPIPLSAGVTALLAGWAVRRLGALVVVFVGAMLPFAGLMLLVWRAGPKPDYLLGLLPGALLFNIGFGLVFGPLNAVTLTSVPEHQLGQASAAVNTVRQLMSGLGIALVVGILGNAPIIALANFRRAYVVLAAVSLAMLLVTVGLVPKQRLRELRR